LRGRRGKIKPPPRRGMECRKVRTTVLLNCTISPLMPIKPPRLHMVREITYLLTSFQGKPKNTLGRLTRNRPTFASSWNKPAANQGNSSIGTLESREDL
jgi:hypothetical protein